VRKQTGKRALFSLEILAIAQLILLESGMSRGNELPYTSRWNTWDFDHKNE
jgi:hypothetical protein